MQKYTNTGVKATKKEVAQIIKLYKKAEATPVISVSGMGFNSFAGRAWDALREATHKLALKHGLPEIPGFYGLNTQTREFLVALEKHKTVGGA